MTSQIKYLSLFSGVGGFELGIQRAFSNKELWQQGQNESALSRHDKPNSSSQPYKRQSAACIGYSEIDKYAIKVYERQFNGHKNYQDITTLNVTDLPDFDLLVGGFPCQAFSVAGRRLGFDDTRGTLFFDIARVLSHKRPRHLLLENVKGLLSHDSGKTFQTILGVLADLGYSVEWNVLNSKDFGVPQNRERVFIIGHLREKCAKQVFPISRVNPVHLKEITSNLSDAQRIYTTDQAKTLKGLGGGMGAKTGLYAVHKNHDKIEKTEDTSHSLDSSYHKGLDNHGQRTGVLEGAKIRRLTPKECERLQGFPDNWTQLDDIGREISDTQRYKMCGNAVTTNVVEAIMSKFMEVHK